MGIGEAAVTILSEQGIPTPVVHTRLRAPASRIGSADDVDAAAKASPLFAEYGTRTEAQSAREALAGRLDGPRGSTPAEDARRISKRRRKEAARATSGGADVLGDFLRSREGKALGRKVARGVFGMLRKRL